MCEVGREAELTLQDLINGLFSILTGERRLQLEDINRGYTHMTNLDSLCIKRSEVKSLVRL